MKSDNPFCNNCKELDCLVSMDGTCSLIRIYIKAKENITNKTRAKYPLDGMLVGDSFYVEKYQGTVTGAISAKAIRLGFKMKTKREGDGTRVWRVA